MTNQGFIIVNLIPLGTIPPTIKGLIFDCDGTLADTMHLHAEAWKEHFEELGINWPPEFFAKIKGVPTENIIAQFGNIVLFVSNLSALTMYAHL